LPLSGHFLVIVARLRSTEAIGEIIFLLELSMWEDADNYQCWNCCIAYEIVKEVRKGARKVEKGFDGQKARSDGLRISILYTI
jgi:hypothetical protein